MKLTLDPLQSFLDYAAAIAHPRVLELGAARSQPERSTLHKSFVPNAVLWHGTDIAMTEDVDFLSDVHALSRFVVPESYDVVITCSGFEHFKYPQLAAFEISKVLALGGAVFVQTHHTFPLHAYPYDYFRFSQEALAACFGTRNGIEVRETGYQFPCSISSEADGHHEGQWLNTLLFGVKTHETPEQYVYDFDTNLVPR